MIARLEANPLVDRVTVSTAGYNDDRSAAGGEAANLRPYATVTIVFKNAEIDEGGER